VYLTGLASVLRAAGLEVVEHDGWETRGHGDLADVRTIVAHHTAGPRSGDLPSLGTVRDGRPGLDGPLSQLMVARSGVWHVVAAGKCWHAGVVRDASYGNSYSIGIEAEATGTDPWPADQYRAYVDGVRALADHYKVPYSRVLGHKEVCYPSGRKTDPNFSMDDFRAALDGSPKRPANPVKPTVDTHAKTYPAFPLPKGHWYGVESNDPHNHSGYVSKDRKGIATVQAQLKERGWRIDHDGRYGPQTERVVTAFQSEKGLGADGKIGPVTWKAAFTAEL
jgi:peptidoglycan hydrolase-like protein with peptidoglycan-binding domain